MAIGPVVTRGYGSFGSVALVVTRGYGIGEAVTAVTKTGTGGIDPREVRRGIIKPTGLLDRAPKKKQPEARKSVEDRVEDARQIQAEIAGELAKELRGEIESAQKAISAMTMAEVDFEIGVLLRKVQRTQEEDLLLLMLMAVT